MYLYKEIDFLFIYLCIYFGLATQGSSCTTPSVFTPLPTTDVFGDFQMAPQVLPINLPVLFPVF